MDGDPRRVLAALAVGVFLAVPALIVGTQDGKIEALFPPGYSKPGELRQGRRVGARGRSRASRLFADHEDEVRAFGARGEEIAGARIGGIRGLARAGVRPMPRRARRLGEEPGPIQHLLRRGEAGAAASSRRSTPARSGEATGFEPEGLAVAPARRRALRDRRRRRPGVGFDRKAHTGDGSTAGRSTPAASTSARTTTTSRSTPPGPAAGDVFVLSARGTARSGHSVRGASAALGTDRRNRATNSPRSPSTPTGGLWIAEPNGDAYEYGDSRTRPAPADTDRRQDRRRRNAVERGRNSPAGTSSSPVNSTAR